jgi:hypothetical protein
MTFEENEADREPPEEMGGSFHCRLPIANCQLLRPTAFLQIGNRQSAIGNH